MEFRTPDLAIHHQLMDLAQIHVHWVGDAIQPPHPLLLPSPLALNPSQHQFSSVTQWCLTLCDPMNCSMPGLPVHHQLPEFTQTHVHWVGDAIQPSHPLSSPSPPASGSFPMSQLFASGGQSIRVSASKSVLPMNTQDWSPLGWSGWISLQPKGTLKSLLQHHSSKASIL